MLVIFVTLQDLSLHSCKHMQPGVYVSYKCTYFTITRLEPIMLKNSPIIPFRTSLPIILFYSHCTTNYSFLFYSDSDNITMQE